MDEVKRLREEAQIYTEWARRNPEWAQYWTDAAAKLNKQADELEQADAQQ